MTNEQRAAWLKGRRTGIGGSDVAAVLGLNPWKTPLDVWNDKLGISEDKEMSEPAYWGRKRIPAAHRQESSKGFSPVH